jgi:cysteine desulfuration protein SufE
MSAPANVAQRQAAMVARFSIIEDTHERLAAITARAKKWPAPTEAERDPVHLVPGCSSRVWLVGTIENGRCHFRMDADSPIVKGLVALLCELFDGATPADIAATDVTLLDELGLSRQLSPTRLNGLAAVERCIRAFAEYSAKP